MLVERACHLPRPASVGWVWPHPPQPHLTFTHLTCRPPTHSPSPAPRWFYSSYSSTLLRCSSSQVSKISLTCMLLAVLESHHRIRMFVIYCTVYIIIWNARYKTRTTFLDFVKESVVQYSLPGNSLRGVNVPLTACPPLRQTLHIPSGR